MENMNAEKKEAKCVFNMGVARALLRRGCTIIDLKPDRENRDKTVPVFKYDEHFKLEFEKLNNEISHAKQQIDSQ